MKVVELNSDQITQLKIRYYDDFLQEQEGRTISYGEMAEIDNLVTDDEIYGAYGGVDFVPDDFSGGDDE